MHAHGAHTSHTRVQYKHQQKFHGKFIFDGDRKTKKCWCINFKCVASRILSPAQTKWSLVKWRYSEYAMRRVRKVFFFLLLLWSPNEQRRRRWNIKKWSDVFIFHNSHRWACLACLLSSVASLLVSSRLNGIVFLWRYFADFPLRNSELKKSKERKGREKI